MTQPTPPTTTTPSDVPNWPLPMPAWQNFPASAQVDETYEYSPGTIPIYVKVRVSFRGNEKLVQWMAAKFNWIMQLMGWGGGP